jgi:hypothetical protein
MGFTRSICNPGVLSADRAATRRMGGLVVTELGILAREALRRKRKGRIIAVFERSFYTALDGLVICVGAREIGSGPLHVLCENHHQRELRQGDAVAVVGTTIRIADKPFASFDAASVWAPECISNWTLSDLQTGLSAVDQFWCGSSIEEGLAAAGCVRFPATCSRLVDAARPGVAALARMLDRGLAGHPIPDGGELAKLMGLGPGLTPSGDDLLGGALIALASLGFLNMRDILWEICRAQLARTNEISQAHLCAAARGHGAAALHAAIHATMGGRVDLMTQALSAVSAVGHTSGRDGFAGVLIVLRAAVRYLGKFAPAGELVQLRMPA